MIILLFDAHKLDISDEFRRCISSLRGNEDKVRIVLNKADLITPQQLMRVYGALMWSLGKVLSTPEVARVYIGSFWDQVLRVDDLRKLFEAEEQDLFHDIQILPRSAAMRKINDLIKRARLAKVHAYIISKLKSEMPSFFGKQAKKDALIKNLKKIYDDVHRQYQMSRGDFPHLAQFQEQLAEYDFSKFPKLNPKLIENVDIMMSKDIARLMQMIPHEDTQTTEVTGGAFGSGHAAPLDPFSGDDVFSLKVGRNAEEWTPGDHLDEYRVDFERLEPKGGKLAGIKAKEVMVKSKLPNSVLKKVWGLADVDKDGMLDLEEFALAMFLIDAKKEGHDLPDALPFHLIPPSKRGLGDDDADDVRDGGGEEEEGD